MKILTNKKFDDKFGALAVSQMEAFFEYFLKIRNETMQDFVKKPDVKLLENKDKIYVCRVGRELRIFFTVITEGGQDGILLLDIISLIEVPR
jgi:hypothetical protein